MKKYDAIVIGSGCGLNIVNDALNHGLKVALVDRGPLGGTCLNVGCIPSKMLIFPADRILEIQEAKKLGIEAEIKNIDFNFIMKRMRESIKRSQDEIRLGLGYSHELDFYESEGRFVDDYTMEVNGEKIKGELIFIASGSRPAIPPIKGLDAVDYLTNESALRLNERPDSIIIIGGGYIGVEYGHFFAAMGSKVTILEMTGGFVPGEEPEISELLQAKLGKRLDIVTNARAEEIRQHENNVTVVIGGKNGPGELTAQRVMIAVGRRSNADLLKVENTGVATDKRGFIKVNEHLETSTKRIFAVGDANGQQMFTHVANRESSLASHNALRGGKLKMDYSAIPHAIFSSPQIAAVGLTAEEAAKSHKILVGRARYFDTAKGEAMDETDGFAKAVVDGESGKILGFHIIGPYAPILIQEVINAMTSGGDIDSIGAGIHIHPALPELIQVALGNLE